MMEMMVRMSAPRQWQDVRCSSVADTLARLSVYTVPSDAKAYTSLLPHFLSPKSTLPHTAVVIVLDWTCPWTFVEELEAWLRWVEQWAKGDGSREVEIVREENRERRAYVRLPYVGVSTYASVVQAHLLHYTEPSADALLAASNLTSNAVLPLGPGTFTHNSAGVPIVVVCTKADLIDEGNNLVGQATSGMGGMVKGKGDEWEERTDSIMQVLRTICLKCEPTCVVLFFQLLADPSTQMAQHSSIQRHSQAHCKFYDNTPYTSFLSLLHHRLVLLQGWKLPRRYGIRSSSITGQTR